MNRQVNRQGLLILLTNKTASLIFRHMNTDIKVIHVVFKTHLDIGFTDLASTITTNYINDFLPRAMETAMDLRELKGRERLVWTTGSWLIYTYLKKANKQGREALSRAVEAGDIAWHALPFTTHTELMDAELYCYGLSYSAGLDKIFNKKTIAAKMTDVPGHTIGMLPFLAKHNIRYLHIGVNDGSHLPEVPRLFRWRSASGSEVIVQYDKSYGETFMHPELDEALVVINSADNHGPPSVASIKKAFADLQFRFPGAEIRASTLDAFVPNLEKIRETLPILNEEIGDTWIHGVATDPKKVAWFKELLRLRRKWVYEKKILPESDSYKNFHDALIMIPEHTWGMDVKKYLGDYVNWSIDDFHNARKRDKVDVSNIPREFRFLHEHAEKELRELYPDRPDLRERFSFSLFESSHKEQREYIQTAVQHLPASLQKETGQAFIHLAPDKNIKTGEKILPGQNFSLGSFTAVIGNTGALISLKNKAGKEFAEKGLGLYTYHSYSHDDYVKYLHEYNRDMCINADWVTSDFSKPGMQYAEPFPRSADYRALFSFAHLHKAEDYDEAAVVLQADPLSPRGAPQKIIIRYKVRKGLSQLQVCVDLFEKEANRLPESLWIGFSLRTSIPARWRFSKLGMLVNPLDVVKGGNRSCHAIDHACYEAVDMTCRITPLDTALAALGKEKMLQFDDRFEDPAGGIFFNIYNNLWGTNFPMWYEEDIRARFFLELA